MSPKEDSLTDKVKKMDLQSKSADKLVTAPPDVPAIVTPVTHEDLLQTLISTYMLGGTTWPEVSDLVIQVPCQNRGHVITPTS